MLVRARPFLTDYLRPDRKHSSVFINGELDAEFPQTTPLERLQTERRALRHWR